MNLPASPGPRLDSLRLVAPAERPLGHRYRPPRLAQALVARHAVRAAWQQAQGMVLVVAGPPGSGKTALLLDCHAAMPEQAAPARWLTLAPEDNDPEVLRAHLCTAFGLAPPVATAGVPPEWPEMPAGVHGFIDGLEVLEQAAAQAVVEHFLLSVPASSRVLVTARRVQGALLHDARLRGVVRVLEPQALRLEAAEAAALLGPAWTPQEAERLNDCVQGWAAGLRFLARAPEVARRWLDGAAGLEVLPAEMADYFEEVLCASLAPQTLEVLMEASVLERFTPALWAAVPPAEAAVPASTAGRWAQVEALLRSGFFIHYADEARQWVVVHPVFGRYLRQRLQRFAPERHAALQRFAAHWLMHHGHAAEAVRHAVAMADVPVAARLIEQAGPMTLVVGNGPDVGLGTLVPAESAGDLPLLFLGQVYHRIRHGQSREARVAFEVARLHTHNFTRLHAQAEGTVVRAWAQIMEVVFLCTGDRPVEAARIATLEADLAAHLDRQPVLAVGIASVLAYLYLDASRHADSATVCSIGLQVRGHSEATKAMLFLRQHQANNALARESVDTAALYLDEAQRLAAQEGGDHSYEVLTTHTMRAVLHYERNELETAWQLLRKVLPHLRHINGWGRLYAEAFGTAAALAGHFEGLDAAEQVLRDGEDFARERDLPRLPGFLAIARLQQLRRAGEWRAAKALVESPPLAGLLASTEREAYVLVQQVPALLAVAHWMLDLGRPREAMDWLDRIPRDFLEEADSRLRFEFRVLAMRAAQGLRRYHAAASHMRAAVDLARQTGLVLRALQARGHLLEVFDWAICHGRDMEGWSERARAWVDETLRHATGHESADTLQQRGRRGVSAGPANPLVLSPRETEIVALIAEGCINKEIGARLGIAEGTVKTHRKKIHEKLGIRNRSQLIVRARELLIV